FHSERKGRSNCHIGQGKPHANRRTEWRRELAQLVVVRILGNACALHTVEPHPGARAHSHEYPVLAGNDCHRGSRQSQTLRIWPAPAKRMGFLHPLHSYLSGPSFCKLVVRSASGTRSCPSGSYGGNVADAGTTSQNGQRAARSQRAPPTRTSRLSGIALWVSDATVSLHRPRRFRRHLGLSLSPCIVTRAPSSRPARGAKLRTVKALLDLGGPSRVLGLFLLLAVDTEMRPWHRFQTLGFNVAAAIETHPVCAIVHAVQCAVDHLKQLRLILALAEQNLSLIGGFGAICGILRTFGAQVPSLLCLAVSLTTKLLACSFQPFL